MKKKAIRVLSALTLVLALGGTGCHKQGTQGQPRTPQEAVIQLRPLLLKANPQVQSNLYNHVDKGIRYENYGEALGGLDAIAADPSINGEQKKAVDDLIAMLKQVAQNQPASPGQAR